MTTHTLQPLTVGLQNRSYDIFIGQDLLARAADLIAAKLPGRRCAIITDENLAKHHLRTLETVLQKADLHIGTIILPAGEATKSIARYEECQSKLLDMEVERGDALIALGGGVIGDLAGFTASSFRRGIPFVQIPTSLLAQVDSSVGGKTGINMPHGKNLVGAFHQPALVLCDINALHTLPKRELSAGLAEVIKYGLIRDKSFFDWLNAHSEELLSLNSDAITHAITTSCAMKAAIVEEDEHEHGVRALLNLGHTFGHALEAYCAYDGRLLHGEAIAIGMVMAIKFSQEQNHCASGLCDKAAALFKKVQLPTHIGDVDALASLDAKTMGTYMRQDKKIAQGNMVLILAKAIGEAFIDKNIDQAKLDAFLLQELGQ